MVRTKIDGRVDVVNGQRRQVNDMIHVDVPGGTGIHGQVVATTENIEAIAGPRSRLGPGENDVSPAAGRAGVGFGVAGVDVNVAGEHDRWGIDEAHLGIVGTDIAAKRGDSTSGHGDRACTGRPTQRADTVDGEITVGGDQREILGTGDVAVEGQVTVVGGQSDQPCCQGHHAGDTQILSGRYGRVELSRADERDAACGRVNRVLDVDRVGRGFGGGHCDRAGHADHTGEVNRVAGRYCEAGELRRAREGDIGVVAVDGQAVPTLQSREADCASCVRGSDRNVIVELHGGQAVQRDTAGRAPSSGVGRVDVSAEV